MALTDVSALAGAPDCLPVLNRANMCENCVAIDNKIDHYLWLAAYVGDKRTVGGIKELIEKMREEKAALHQEKK